MVNFLPVNEMLKRKNVMVLFAFEQDILALI